MSEYYIDFEGYCVIEAENEEEAKKKFWQIIQSDEPLPSNLYEIQSVEEVERGVY